MPGEPHLGDFSALVARRVPSWVTWVLGPFPCHLCPRLASVGVLGATEAEGRKQYLSCLVCHVLSVTPRGTLTVLAVLWQPITASLLSVDKHTP